MRSSKNGKENCITEINMTKNYLQHAMQICKVSAEEVITTTTKGVKNKLLLSVLKKLTKPLNYNMTRIRRSIAQKLQQEKKYNFSI